MNENNVDAPPDAGRGAPPPAPSSNVSDESLATLIAVTGGDESTARGLLEVSGRERRREKAKERTKRWKMKTRGAPQKNAAENPSETTSRWSISFRTFLPREREKESERKKRDRVGRERASSPLLPPVRAIFAAGAVLDLSAVAVAALPLCCEGPEALEEILESRRARAAGEMPPAVVVDVDVDDTSSTAAAVSAPLGVVVATFVASLGLFETSFPVSEMTKRRRGERSRRKKRERLPFEVESKK